MSTVRFGSLFVGHFPHLSQSDAGTLQSKLDSFKQAHPDQLRVSLTADRSKKPGRQPYSFALDTGPGASIADKDVLVWLAAVSTAEALSAAGGLRRGPFSGMTWAMTNDASQRLENIKSVRGLMALKRTGLGALAQLFKRWAGSSTMKPC